MEKNIMQVIVYGGTGYYGHKVVEKLLQKGQPVKVVSRNLESARKIISKLVKSKGRIAKNEPNHRQ